MTSLHCSSTLTSSSSPESSTHRSMTPRGWRSSRTMSRTCIAWWWSPSSQTRCSCNTQFYFGGVGMRENGQFHQAIKANFRVLLYPPAPPMNWNVQFGNFLARLCKVLWLLSFLVSILLSQVKAKESSNLPPHHHPIPPHISQTKSNLLPQLNRI